MQPGRVLETKRTLDGRIQTFECAALRLTRSLAIVRFDHPAERRAGRFYFPAGSYTLGYFWVRRSYNCYRIADPDGAVIAYRFDVVDRVRIRPGHVEYRDLLLDLWLSPDGEITVEDEDEVSAATTAGLLGEREMAVIERTRALVLREHRRIVAECEALVAAS
jgi:predicted RNA-binding protein associated with RNAse of E/G family